MHDRQPAIADVLGITYEHPIDDETGWQRVFNDTAQAPDPPSRETFAGPLGLLTTAIAPHVPWDPIAFHAQALATLGNYLGYQPFIAEGAILRRPNLFLALIGGTGSGKGSSLRWVNWMMNIIDDAYVANRTITAVGSGQGLLAKITDPVYTADKNGKQVPTILGSDDKRVLYLEEELEALFNKMSTREEVEKMITKAWDSGIMETTTKHESMRCTTPHVSIIGHITGDELYERLDRRLVDNGYSNRWLYVLIKSTQTMALEAQPHEVGGIAELARRIGKNVHQVMADPGAAEFILSPDADEAFRETASYMYERSTTGAMAKQTVRWRSQMFKMAVIHAALDGTATIAAEHFLAARAMWAYSARSTHSFLGGLTGNGNVDKFLAFWSTLDYDDLTLSDVSDMFSKNLPAVKRDVMLNQLMRDGILRVDRGDPGPNGGRPRRVVRYTGHLSHLNPMAPW